jgi:hypothetical protein
MKKTFYLLMVALFTALSANGAKLYVATTGDDATGDGSLASPYASVEKASLMVASGDTIIVAEGTYTSVTSANSLSNAVSYTVQGAGAGKTILQGSPDPISHTNSPNLRLIGAATVGTEFTFSDLTIRNYGWYASDNGGGAINCNEATVVINVKRCNFEGNYARIGGAIQVNKGTVKIEDCYFADNACIPNRTKPNNKGNYTSSCLQITTASTLTVVKNCVFYNNTRIDNPLNADGTVAFSGTSTSPVVARVLKDVAFINNTFVDNKTSDGFEGNSATAIGIEVGKNVKFVNNLFVDNKRTGKEDIELACQSGLSGLDDSIAYNVIGTYSVGNAADTALFIANNTVNASFTKTSTEINVEMDGAAPKLKTTPTGVLYIEATGTEIVEKGLGSATDSDVPLKDITGALRNVTNPWIGAVEVISTRLNESDKSSFVNVYTSGKRVNIVSDEPMSYAIYNVDGKLIKSVHSVVGMNSFEVNSSGLYIVKMNSRFGSKTFKVIAR